jgi:hypothetical protein
MRLLLPLHLPRHQNLPEQTLKQMLLLIRRVQKLLIRQLLPHHLTRQ